MVRTHVRGQQPHGVRRLLPRTRHRTRRATGTAHVHPHARRATGATGALSEERSTAKTTVCRASGTTTRQTTSARARSSPMRGPDLAQLSRRRTPRIQEESLVGSIAYVASRPRPGATRYGAYAVLRVRVYTWCIHMAEDGNRTTFDAGCRGRDAVPCAPRARRTSNLTRGALPALPARCVKSDRRRRRLYVAPRERRRDRRRVRERALLPCVDLTSRSCRDVELRAYKKSRSSARSRTSRRAQSRSDALWRPHAPLLCVREYTWCVHMAED